MIRATAGAALLLLSLGACGSDAVGQAAAWADRACACQDTACALDIREQFSTWVEKNRELRGSRSERKRIEESASRLFGCLDRQAAASPGTAE